jgi:hypothetical protein
MPCKGTTKIEIETTFQKIVLAKVTLRLFWAQTAKPIARKLKNVTPN